MDERRRPNGVDGPEPHKVTVRADADDSLRMTFKIESPKREVPKLTIRLPPQPDSGRESPRIILKINKTERGPTSETSFVAKPVDPEDPLAEPPDPPGPPGPPEPSERPEPDDEADPLDDDDPEDPLAIDTPPTPPTPPTPDATPRRGRGRPRKRPAEEAAARAALGSERTLRRREPAPPKTPRGRGRGRGGRPRQPPQRAVSFVDADVETEPEADADADSDDDAEPDDSAPDGDARSSPSASPSPPPPEIEPSGRARGRGRGGRGSRRGRGARTPRAARGAKGGRTARAPAAVYEEVQLQDPGPSERGARPELFEEETCMVGDDDDAASERSPAASGRGAEASSDEATRDSTTERSDRASGRPDVFDRGKKIRSPADVVEYDWPPEGCSPDSPPQTWMIQEQVALYLGVKNFKRKYPDLGRRTLEPEERGFLLERNLISEAMCELGVTVVDAGEILDIMFTDFPAKYEEYRRHLRETRDSRAANRPPPNLATERSKQETLERAIQSASSWNARLNRQRRTLRSAAVDLQTLTLHRPRRRQTVAECPRPVSHYPLALLPGQYTDFYRPYTDEELRYFPLNTVLNRITSPQRPEEDSVSEESAEDSDAVEGSSEGSDSESSEKNFKRRRVNPKSKRVALSNAVDDVASSRPVSPSVGQQSAVPSPLAAPAEVQRCKLCNGTEHANRRYPTETFITCATCQKKIHPSCLEMSANVAKCVRLYAWQCPDCKCCATCEDLADDDKMLFCDLCDRGYHIYCVGLKKVPTGRWHCNHCAICRSCGARDPSGLPEAPRVLGPPDQWHHHLKKNNSGQRVYSHTLCGPCARAWRAGRYCSLCERCFMGKKGALKVVICVNCDRTHHKECVRQPGRTLDVLNYMCNGCRRGNTPRRHVVPRKYVKRRISQPSNNAESVSGVTQNSSRIEPVSLLDLSVDSVCTNDSNHRSNSTYDGTFEESNSNKASLDTPLRVVNLLYDGKPLKKMVVSLNKNEADDAINRLANNHIQKDTLKIVNDHLNNILNDKIIQESVDVAKATAADGVAKNKITSLANDKAAAGDSAMDGSEKGTASPVNENDSYSSNLNSKYSPLLDSCRVNDSMCNEINNSEIPMEVDVQYENNSENL